MGDYMKKAISRMLFVLFFGFAVALFAACFMLVLSNIKSSSDTGDLAGVPINIEDENESSYSRIDELSLSQADQTEEISVNYGYDCLSDSNQRYLYHQMEEKVYHISNESDVNGNYKTERITVKDVEMSEDAIRAALNAFVFDNPQIFWLNNIFGYTNLDGSTYVECYSVLPADECSRKIEVFTTEIEKLTENMDSALSDYDKEKLLHDRLLEKCSYKDGVYSMDHGWQYFSAYGAVVEGECVCEGYAKAMQILLKSCGITSCTIRGVADGINHMWNVVLLDGKWYHLDPTWDDNEETISYEYFNVTTEDVSFNHSISNTLDQSETGGYEDNANFFVPDCVSEDMNYYTVEGVTFDSVSDESFNMMVDYITGRVNSGEHYIAIKVGPNLSFRDCVREMFEDPNNSFFRYVDKANESLDEDHQIQHKGVKILKNEDRKTIRLRINY